MKRLLLLLLLSTHGFAYHKACDFSDTTPITRAPSRTSDPVAIKAYDILNANCAKCHGKGATGGAGVFNDVLDRDELVRGAFVNLTDPSNSRLFLAITRAVRPMPLGSSPLSLTDKTAILDWIKAGAPAWDDPTVPPPTSKYVNYKQIVECIAYDAEDIDYKRKGDAFNFRYFDLSNIYNTGNASKFKNTVWALDKALNQTAFGPVRIVNSKPLDKDGVVRRIDLRDYAYSQDDWDVLLLGLYPYAIDYAKGNFYARKEIDEIIDFEDDIEEFTGSPRAWLRGDWFIDEALGDLYYTLLFDKGQADNLVQLEKTLGVNANDALANFEADAGIVRRSGVSIWNRVIHRYDSTYLIRGVKTDTYYWKTFDVINEVANRAFFGFPLGPEGVDFGFKTQKVFQFDAGEEIFGLPNGLEGYYIADAKGNRLQEAATSVAVDRDNQSPYIGSAPGVVQVGVSCNHCHGGGVNAFADQLLYHSSNTSGFTKAEINAINQLFPPNSVWNASFASYNTAFQASVKQVVADPVALVAETEPTWVVTRTYQDYQSAVDVAGELGLSADEFISCLFHSPDLAQELGISEPKLGRVAREAIEDNFGRIADECGLGELILFSKRPPPIKPPPIKPPPGKCEYSIKNNDQYQLIFKPAGDAHADASREERVPVGSSTRGNGPRDIQFWYGRTTNKFFPFRLECKDYQYSDRVFR